MDKIRNQSVENLVQVIAKMDSADDVYNFLSDLCTIKELQDMAQRFDMALLLKDGANYQNIAATVGASSATISRVNRSLQYGADGYAIAFRRMGLPVRGDGEEEEDE